MDLGILLLALTLGAILLLKQTRPVKKKTEKPETPTPVIREDQINRVLTRPTITNGPSWQPNNVISPGTRNIPTPTPAWDLAFTRAYSQLQPGSQNRREKTMVEEWRKSISGLIKLADQNLRLAKQHLTMGEPKIAIQTAATSVENIARALIHAYGGKPDDDLGQEEVLELLSRRFEGKEKEEFEKSIHKIAKVDIHTRNSLKATECPADEAREIISLASETALSFKKILIDHFATEIPELNETCPKCHSLDIRTLAFNQQQTNFNCLNCQNKWTDPRGC
jgi:HEPN domain-containing protein